MAKWRAEILAGVEEVPRLGVPGTIIVFGDNSEPILTNEHAEAFIAAAEDVKGRIVVFSHTSYTKEFLRSSPHAGFEQLVKNIKSWVTNGTLKTDAEIENLDEYTDFDKIPSTCKLLVWSGTLEKTDTLYKKLNSWLQDGGALVSGATPWGFLQLNPDKTLDMIPIYQVLKTVDICYTAEYLGGSGPIEVSRNQADEAHLGKIIKASQDDINTLLKHRSNIEYAIEYLPDDALPKIIDDITEMVEHHAKTWHCIPSRSKPVKTPEGRALASIMCHIYIRLGEYNTKKIAPDIDQFPGDFETSPALVTVSLTATNKGQPATSYPTGYYLPAGQDLIVTRTTTNTKPWKIVVGCHSDQLYNKEKAWSRWPYIQVVTTLKQEKTTVRSPFGGLIYLRCEKGVSDTLGVKLENVVPAPLLDATVSETVGDWDNRRDDPGLWGDVAGEALVISLPASSLRDLSDPSKTMVWWDSVWRAHVDLRGLDPQEGRREWLVTDEEPSAGYMHSGYPIVTGLDVAVPGKNFLLNGEVLRKNGSWGVFHELGHNIQDSQWTFSGTGEVTCNIFTLHAMDVITGQKPWIHPWLQGKLPTAKKYLLAGANFEEWTSNPGLALFIYAELARDFGWHTYKTVFHQYNDLPPSEHPVNDAEKIDQWIVRFSKVAKKNLCPMFDFWGFPIRASVLADLEPLTKFLHSDETTNEMAPARASDIRKKYGMD